MTDEELIARLLDAANGVHDMTPICSTLLDAADRIYNLGILLHDMAEAKAEALEKRLDAVKDKAEAHIIDLMAERDRAEARAERLEAAIRELQHRWYLGDLQEKDFTAALKEADDE